jgi:hypothetical protein
MVRTFATASAANNADTATLPANPGFHSAALKALESLVTPPQPVASDALDSDDIAALLAGEDLLLPTDLDEVSASVIPANAAVSAVQAHPAKAGSVQHSAGPTVSSVSSEEELVEQGAVATKPTTTTASATSAGCTTTTTAKSSGAAKQCPASPVPDDSYFSRPLSPKLVEAWNELVGPVSGTPADKHGGGSGLAVAPTKGILKRAAPAVVSPTTNAKKARAPRIIAADPDSPSHNSMGIKGDLAVIMNPVLSAAAIPDKSFFDDAKRHWSSDVRDMLHELRSKPEDFKRGSILCFVLWSAIRNGCRKEVCDLIHSQIIGSGPNNTEARMFTYLENYAKGGSFVWWDHTGECTLAFNSKMVPHTETRVWPSLAAYFEPSEKQSSRIIVPRPLF